MELFMMIMAVVLFLAMAVLLVIMASGDTTSSMPLNQHQDCPVGWREYTVALAVGDCDTDGTGDEVITLGDCIEILKDSVQIACQAGFFASVQSVSGNQITARFYTDSNVATTEAPSEDTGTGVTAAVIRCLGR